MTLQAPIVVKARQNDTLDMVVWRTLGLASPAVEVVLEANPAIARGPAFLEAGVEVLIPIAADAPPTTRQIQLWD